MNTPQLELEMPSAAPEENAVSMRLDGGTTITLDKAVHVRKSRQYPLLATARFFIRSQRD
jgi:hypothetical protein